MPKFYKRGALGRMVEAEGGSSDPELAEVRMTEEEYRGMVDQIRSAKRDAEYARADAREKIAAAQRRSQQEAAEYKRQAEATADRRVQIAQAGARKSEEEAVALRAELSATREALQKEKYLHGNMIRIMKERANQTRGIKPKKQHDGYLVLESRQWVERYTVETWDTEDHKKRYSEDLRTAIRQGYLRVEQKTANVWKSILQTPYDASIPLNQIRSKVEDDDLWVGGILKDIGCPGMCENVANGTYMEFGKSEDGYDQNGLYKWKFKANYRSGLWELEIFTTKSLRVPEHRRPPQRLKGKGKPQKKAAGAETLYADDSDLDHTWYPDASDLFGDQWDENDDD